MEKEYTWWIENHSFTETFNSKEEAIKNAKTCRKDLCEQFDDYDETDAPNSVNIGEVEHFNVKNAVKDFVEDIEDHLDSNLSDFAFGCDQESECSITNKDYKKFVKEATDVLYPLVKKYFQFNPEMTATPIGTYDLDKDAWEG